MAHNKDKIGNKFNVLFITVSFEIKILCLHRQTYETFIIYIFGHIWGKIIFCYVNKCRVVQNYDFSIV